MVELRPGFRIRRLDTHNIIVEEDSIRDSKRCTPYRKIHGYYTTMGQAIQAVWKRDLLLGDPEAQDVMTSLETYVQEHDQVIDELSTAVQGIEPVTVLETTDDDIPVSISWRNKEYTLTTDNTK